MTKLSAARREIIAAYEVVRQAPKEGSIVRQVCSFLGRKLDGNKNNTFVRTVINEYKSTLNQK